VSYQVSGKAVHLLSVPIHLSSEQQLRYVRHLGTIELLYDVNFCHERVTYATTALDAYDLLCTRTVRLQH
jgi:hypothetical protein